MYFKMRFYKAVAAMRLMITLRPLVIIDAMWSRRTATNCAFSKLRWSKKEKVSGQKSKIKGFRVALLALHAPGPFV
jgi:hypothetical protein